MATPARYPPRTVRVIEEAGAALALATPRWRGAPADATVVVAALAWQPIAGALLGVVAAALVLAGAPWWGAPAGGLVGLAALRWLRADRLDALGVALLAAEAGAIVLPDVGAQALALVLAPALGGWSVVVQCHGGRPAAHAHGLVRMVVGRAGSREFAWASVLAIAAPLVMLDAVGLVVVMAAALVTLAARVIMHRAAGGMPSTGLDWTRRLVEAVVLVGLGVLGWTL